jgi:hypothetical protein
VSELIDYGWTTVPRKWLEGKLLSDREQMLQYRVALYAAVGFDKAKVRELMLLVEGLTLKEAEREYLAMQALISEKPAPTKVRWRLDG